MSKKIIIGSRGSKLALLYAQQAKDKIIENTNLGNDDILIKSITTKGDEVQDIRLSELGGKGLFSSNIEKELQLKNICLLYTSPSPRDLSTSRMPSSA